MSAENSALAALGLRPGASRAEVDSAYRRLMKIHHPDRTGGDAGRAAEINRAYTFLRRHYPTRLADARRVPITIHRHRRPRGRGAWAFVFVGAAATGLVAYSQAPLELRGSSRLVEVESAAIDSKPLTQVAAPVSNFDEPLHSGVIGAAIATAMKFNSSDDRAGAAEYSRDCHDRLRSQPNLALFDACAAFDESTLVLSANGPGEGTGSFNGSAVTARQMAAARALSDDTFGADSRLHRIRSEVEIALLTSLEEVGGTPQP